MRARRLVGACSVGCQSYDARAHPTPPHTLAQAAASLNKQFTALQAETGNTMDGLKE